MTLRNGLTSLLFLLAAGFSILSVLTSNPSLPTRPAEDTHLPDAYMEDIVAIMMNKQGAPSVKLSTPKMIHYSANDTTHIQKPSLIVYRKSPNPWDINSEYAEATHGIEKINFINHVVMTHFADQESPTTTMQTTTLIVFPNDQSAQTDQPVTIKQPDTTIQAKGMQANIHDGTVKLLSEAKGEYIPP